MNSDPLRRSEGMSCLHMPTPRTLLFLGVFGVLGAITGCAAEDAGDDGLSSQEGEIGAAQAGITKGSLEEEGVLLLVNDRAVNADMLEKRANVTPAFASALVGHRKADDGKQRWFASIDELDALPSSDRVGFERLLADAKANGYVEAPGFDRPAFRLEVPENLGRPPTHADVIVHAGFDGKTPDEVVSLVRGRITNDVYEGNERFVAETIRENHKAFTLAINNMYVENSPHLTFAHALAADSLTMLGTMSSMNRTILKAEKAGVVTWYARGASGRYEQLPAEPKYPIIMRAKLKLPSRRQEPGVRVFYPAWRAKNLTGPTTTIIENQS